MERQRFKEALRSIMGIAQIGNVLLQNAAPWKHISSEESKERQQSLSALAMAWRLCRTLSILTRPFMPFQSERLWSMLGETEDIDSMLWDHSLDTNSELHWNPENPQPLFSRLDLEEIIADEKSIVEDSNDNDPGHNPGGGADYIEFDDFLKVQMKTGKITSVEDHPNADKLLVIKIEDAPGSSRTVCAGLKGICLLYTSPSPRD